MASGPPRGWGFGLTLSLKLNKIHLLCLVGVYRNLWQQTGTQQAVPASVMMNEREDVNLQLVGRAC